MGMNLFPDENVNPNKLSLITTASKRGPAYSTVAVHLFEAGCEQLPEVHLPTVLSKLVKERIEERAVSKSDSLFSFLHYITLY